MMLTISALGLQWPRQPTVDTVARQTVHLVVSNQCFSCLKIQLDSDSMGSLNLDPGPGIGKKNKRKFHLGKSNY
jgi:hypothetical protein